MYDRYFIQLRKDFKPVMVRKRKEFMELLLKAMSEDEEAVKELSHKFGVTLVTKITNGNSVNIFVDGESIYKI